jgi:cytochrome c5
MARIQQLVLIATSLILAGVLAGCSGATEEATPVTGSSAADAAADAVGAQNASDPAAVLVEQKCTMCHTLERVDSASYDAATWSQVIDRMKQNGLVITDDEKATIAEYLGGGK